MLAKEIDPLARVRSKIRELGIREDDIAKAVAWARSCDGRSQPPRPS